MIVKRCDHCGAEEDQDARLFVRSMTVEHPPSVAPGGPERVDLCGFCWHQFVSFWLGTPP